MNTVSLGRRFASTLIDKLVIFVLFVFFALIFRSGVPGAELGTFFGLMERPYKQIESTKTIYEGNVENRDFMKSHGYGDYDFTDTDMKYEHYKTYMDVYHKYVIIFIIINLLYYFLNEYYLKASLGKKMLKCRVVKNGNTEMNIRDVFTRTGILATLMISAIVVQAWLNMSALVVSLLFFVALDLTVFTKRVSLIDKYSDTMVVYLK